MAPPANTNPIALWPFGKITVTTHGTPVALTINVGSQAQSASLPFGSRRIRQVVFSVDPASSGNIFVVKTGYKYTDTNGVLLVCYKTVGFEYSLPCGGLAVGALILPDDISIDADADGSIVYATGIYG